MLYIQVKDGRDPRVLAELIAATEPEHAVDPKVAIEAKLVRAHQEQEQAARPNRHEIETVNFQTLDDDNDWTDL
jgi:hypothetical protein